MERNYRELLEHGNKAQLEKLLENKHKEDWPNEIDYTYACMDLEMKELQKEVYRGYGVDFSKIRREAADVANFAHMIILACDRRLNNEQP